MQSFVQLCIICTAISVADADDSVAYANRYQLSQTFYNRSSTDMHGTSHGSAASLLHLGRWVPVKSKHAHFKGHDLGRSGCEVLWMSISVCVSLSVREDISETTSAFFTNFFVHVTYVRGSVLLRHVDDRPHRLSAGRGWRECTVRPNWCNLRLPC